MRQIQIEIRQKRNLATRIKILMTNKKETLKVTN